MIVSLVVLLLVLLGVAWWWVVQPHGRDALGRDGQLPLFSARTPGSVLRVVATRPRGVVRVDRAARAAAPVADREVPIPLTTALDPAPPAGRAARVRQAAAETSEASPNGVHNGNGAHRHSAGGATSSDAAKWAPPVEEPPANGTIQFLPGRLDVVQGRGVAGQEVRFVRPTRPGERAVVTFGRGEGPLYRHVQLNVPTVSRLHARLALDDASGRWMVENLSSTNPTVVNDDQLPAGGAARPLRDGDRLEMGEVIFTFHSQ